MLILFLYGLKYSSPKTIDTFELSKIIVIDKKLRAGFCLYT